MRHADMLRRGWDAWCVFWARARRNRNENENEPRQGGGASTSKKLLAAIAVLAVAFAVFAAIPVAVDDSDAEVGTPDWTSGLTYYVGGEGASDDTGDGTVSKPFATVARAVDYFNANAGDKNTLTVELNSNVTGNGVKVGNVKLVNFKYNFPKE